MFMSIYKYYIRQKVLYTTKSIIYDNTTESVHKKLKYLLININTTKIYI